MFVVIILSHDEWLKGILSLLNWHEHHQWMKATDRDVLYSQLHATFSTD
ncbi:hypothetical protein ACSQ4C_005196 [Escherichia coli]